MTSEVAGDGSIGPGRPDRRLPGCGRGRSLPAGGARGAGDAGAAAKAWLRFVLCEAAQTAKRSPQFAATFQPATPY